MQDPSRPATGYPAPHFHHPNGGGPGTGAAYAYGAPPPQYYAVPAPPPPPWRPSRSIFRVFLATMICLAVVFGVCLIVTWLVLRPSLPQFRLHTLSLSNLSTTAQSLSATWQLSFVVRNGNRKMSVTYNALHSSLFYRDSYVAESQLQPFHQDTKSQTTLNATLSAAATYLDPGHLNDLAQEKARGQILFDAQIIASTSFRSGSWRFRTRVLKVLCRKVPVAVASNATSGVLLDGDRDCQVWT
ncbi:hypothetical protein Fmac_019478 [Flemingia macrophylla]|uniref:Late embryogenesis abundant protein LEA-2 subgroup domain-containing protein n=1 Tax=Flemingia macrophylla TaxID=520843 RepID=A0ABD1M7Z9_9FABA